MEQQPAPGPAGRHVGAGIKDLLASRMIEQLVFGLASLWLAARLGIDAFAPVSVLFVINSISVTGSDFGLGLAVLRLGPSVQLSTGSLSRLRLFNFAIGVIAVAIGVVLGGSSGLLVAASGIVWGLSAEAYVRKSAAIKLGNTRMTATAEITSSILFSCVVIVAGIKTSDALVLVAFAFTAKHLLELAIIRRWRDVFHETGERPSLGALWGSQLVAYLIANVDYVLVGVLFSPATFSLYVLGFRIANALPSQISAAVSRISVVDFGEAISAEDRQRSYDVYVRHLFVAGIAGGLVTMLISPLFPRLLGPEWANLPPVIIVLALAVPWRLVLGVAGSMVLAIGEATKLLTWELTRLVAFAAILYLGGRVGFGPFVATVTISTAATVLAYHPLGGSAAGIRSSRILVPLGIATMIAALVAVPFVSAAGG